MKSPVLRIVLAVLLSGAVTVVFQSRATPSVEAQASDPCASVPATASSNAAGVSSGAAAANDKSRRLDHDDSGRRFDSLWMHRAAVAQHRLRPSAAAAQPQDVGDVAVLRDTGDLVITPNSFDLADIAFRLTRNNDGGYDLSKGTYAFRQPLGTAVTLSDDDAREVALPFSFSYFGVSYDRVFVNSDGSLTFSQGDTASSARSVSRLMTGPPRVAPLFTDLDPSAGGRVLTSGDAGAFTVTWCGVPQFQTRRTPNPPRATVQVTLLVDGSIELQVSGRTTIQEGIVGISPGQTVDFLPLDLSAGERVAGGRSALGERFTAASELDTISVARRFLASHPDVFDNIVVFTDAELLTDSFAYELTISNAIRGLGIPSFDESKEYGSGGRLQSLVNMDALRKYPDDPRQQFLGENSTVSVIGQEVGHRWLARLQFRDANGLPSSSLLGRDGAHWSFFFDSDASVMEGNRIEDLGGGSFRTVAAVERYSLLDQYAMGLVDKREVPPFFYVQSPTNVVPLRSATSAPDVGVTFNGTRRDVRIDDVIAAVGDRAPSAADSPRVHSQAFIYVVSAGRAVDPEAITKVDRIRVAWDQFLSAATDFRMRAETRLARPGE